MQVVLYARVSNSSANSQRPSCSLTGQLRSLRNHAKKRSWRIYHEFVDENISGSSDDRAVFQEMMQWALSHQHHYYL